MKYINIILATLFFGCGTDQAEGDVYYYSITNNSGKPIVIKSYRSDFPNQEPKVTNLGINEKIEKVFKDGLPPSGYTFKDFLGESRFRDSIVVIYAKERYSIFMEECNQNQRNPLDYCIYSDDLTEDFVFTEEDYNSATECSSSCN